MDETLRDFQATVLTYYREHGRHDLPWRLPYANGTFDPYAILVSEIMLQQTQVARVRPKFAAFLTLFPTTADLAAAPLSEVLRAWSGLGYNRRAKFLWQAAQAVTQQHHGELPRTIAELVALPGIGPNTAGAVLAYAYNKPTVFIETNIRTVFIHHFFADQSSVPDKALLDIVAHALPDDARTWYWALMDYGVHIKQTVGNLNRQGKNYAVQSRFEGSRRQLRGRVLHLLRERPHTSSELHAVLQDERAQSVLDDLVAERLIACTNAGYALPDA